MKMSILSFEFLFFVLVVLIFYYVLPLRFRWMALLLFSGVFVALSGWQGAVHLSVVALITWGGALVLSDLRRREKNAEEPARTQKYALSRRVLLAALLLCDLGSMIFVKYYPVVAHWLNGWLLTDRKQGLPAWDMIVPLGLSYFTFQTAGYLIDVYWEKAEAMKNPLRTMLFAGYFLQLPQGPISNWRDLEKQLSTGHRLEPVNIVTGFQLMVWGYFKKLVIADRLAATTEALLTGESLPGWLVLGGVILYTVRLYADFSGGMDVVRGISRMLGISLPENFQRPFFSKSVAEYWRRWQITLGAWFRSYLLYPLATSRAGIALGKRSSRILGKKTARVLPTALATLLVFLMIGIWHMASWNAVVYGGYFGILMAVSMLLEPAWRWMNRQFRLPKGGWMAAFRMIRTWGLVLLAQYFAFTADPGQGLSLLRQTFSNWDFSNFTGLCAEIMMPLEWLIAGIALAALLIVDMMAEKKMDVGSALARTHVYIRWPVWLIMIACVLVFGCYGQGFDSSAFLYTQF